MRSQGSHEHRELRRADLQPDPIGQFLSWFDDAGAAGIALPNAMALATTGADGQPSVRYVLLREADQRGFVFYTNHGSRKGRQLDENPRAAIVFLWNELDRQVSVTGGVRRVDDHESDAYFATRPREAQIGAWASAQSSVLRDRHELDVGIAAAQVALPLVEARRRPPQRVRARLRRHDRRRRQGLDAASRLP